MGYDTPPEETKQQRKNRLQTIHRYWAIRWYKYKSIPDWKWAMQFAFNAPYQYTMAMCTQYSPENHHLYYPKPPKKPHKNTTLTLMTSQQRLNVSESLLRRSVSKMRRR